MKVLSLSADGDLIIPDEAETKSACNAMFEKEAADQMNAWRLKYPRPKSVAKPEAAPKPEDTPTNDTDKTSVVVKAGTCFPNEEEMISKSGEQIVKRAPMPPVQAAIYKKIEMVLAATKAGVQPMANGHRTWLHNLTDSDVSLSPGTYLGEGGAGTFISVATNPLMEDQKPYAWRFTRVTSHKRDSAVTGNALMAYIPDATAPPADGACR